MPGDNFYLMHFAVEGRHIGAAADDHGLTETGRLQIVMPKNSPAEEVSCRQGVGLGGKDEHHFRGRFAGRQPHGQAGDIDSTSSGPQNCAIFFGQGIEHSSSQGQDDAVPSRTGWAIHFQPRSDQQTGWRRFGDASRRRGRRRGFIGNLGDELIFQSFDLIQNLRIFLLPFQPGTAFCT